MKARDRVSMCRWAFTAGAVLFALLLAAPGLLGQSTYDVSSLQRIYEAESHRIDLQSAITNNRQAVVSQMADSWVATAQARGFGDNWRAELEGALTGLCDDKLMAAHDASSYDEVVNIIMGRAASSRRTSPPTGLSASGIRLIGDDASDLVFFPVTPCREIDTRVAGGAIGAGASRNFLVNGNMTGQGGSAGGCGIPVDPAAVVMTLTATQEAANGNLIAYPYLGAVPNTSAINYRTGVDIANTTVIPTCQICGLDITLKANAGGTDVVGDIVGYFWSPNSTAVDNQVKANTVAVGAGVDFDVYSLACDAGYRLTGGGIINGTYTGLTNFAGTRPVQGATTGIISGNNTGDRYLCQGHVATAQNVTCFAICAKIPGR